MPNKTLLVSSPSIKGDVSSCTTNIVYLNNSSRTNPFTQNDVGFATNNCTGETQQFNSWEFSGLSQGLFSLVFVVICMVLIGKGIKYIADN